MPLYEILRSTIIGNRRRSIGECIELSERQAKYLLMGQAPFLKHADGNAETGVTAVHHDTPSQDRKEDANA